MLAVRSGGPREQPLPFRLDGDLAQGDPSGIVVTRATAERVGLSIGDTLTVAGWCTGDGDPVELANPIDMVVTGLSVGAFDVEPPGSGQTIEPAYVDATVLESLYAAGAEQPQFSAVWLADESTPAITRAIEGYDGVMDLAEQSAIIDAALDADARPLWILVAAGALTGMLLLTPIIDRSIRDDTNDVATLVALGSTQTQIRIQAVSHVAAVAAGGVLIAIVLAPLIAAGLPIGLAGMIVADDVWLDPLAMSLGIVLLFAAVVAVAAWSTWRLVAGRRMRRPINTLTTDRAVGWLRLRPPAQIGVLAAVGRPAGRRLVSPWPGLVSLGLAGTICVAGLTYVAGLRNLEQSPELLGWNWDAAVYVDSAADDRARVVDEIERLDGVRDATVGTYWPPVFLSMPGSDLQVSPWSFATGPDAITPRMVEGRAPDGPDEVAIDLVFQDVTGLGPGDTVQLRRPTLAEQLADQLEHLLSPGVGVEPPGHQPVVATFEITGIAVMPVNHTHLTPQTTFTLAGLAEFATPSADELEATRSWLPDDLPPDVYDEIETRLTDFDITDRLVYVRTSGDPRTVADRLGRLDGVGDVVAPRPLEVVTLLSALNLAGSDNVPLTLAILTAVVALALVTYLLATSMWARRAELAVMRALGMSSWGVRASLAVHAIATVILVLAVAVPVGIAIGQWAWMDYARDLLVIPEATIPWSALAVVLVGAIVVVGSVALLATQVVFRRSAARELRAE
jgi:hypothetical protein